MNEISICNRKSACVGLKKFDTCAKEFDFVEVTEWGSGEGYDINLGDKILSVSYSQLEAINYLVKTLDYGLIKNN